MGHSCCGSTAPRSFDDRVRAFNQFVSGAGMAVVIVLAVWALTGRGYFWPAWVVLGLVVATAGWARATWSGIDDD
jgi:hypothetical protein